MFIIAHLIGTVVALYVCSAVVPGFHIESLLAASVAAVLLGISALTVRPVLLLLTLPITFLTLGLFSFVINAGILLAVAKVVEGFTLDGFIPALIASVLIASIQWIVHSLS